MPDAFLDLNVFHFMLVFARVGTVIAFLPGFSASYVPTRVRLGLALLIALVLVPVLSSGLPSLPATPLALALDLVHETLIGAFIGSVARIAIAALHTAGTLISYFMSLTSAFIQDPIADQQSSILSGFFSVLGLVLLFATGLHRVMLEAIRQSYVVFPVTPWPPVGDITETIVKTVADSFLIGVQISAPFLVITFAYNVTLGLLGRLMPQLPVFFFGLPLQIGMQIWIMMLALSTMMLVFLQYFEETTRAFVGG